MSSSRSPLHRDRILDEAVALADEQGLSALSMRSLGARLGVEAMSLYRHVASKDELLDGCVDRVVAAMPRAVPGAPWRDSVRASALGAHAVLLAHPWAGALALERPVVGPARLRYVDDFLGCLRAAGFDTRLAHHAMHALDNHVFGFTESERRLAPGLADSGPGIAAIVSGERAAEFPHIHEAVSSGVHDHAEEYALLLEILLEGYEARRASLLRARAE